MSSLRAQAGLDAGRELARAGALRAIRQPLNGCRAERGRAASPGEKKIRPQIYRPDAVCAVRLRHGVGEAARRRCDAMRCGYLSRRATLSIAPIRGRRCTVCPPAEAWLPIRGVERGRAGPFSREQPLSHPTASVALAGGATKARRLRPQLFREMAQPILRDGEHPSGTRLSILRTPRRGRKSLGKAGRARWPLAGGASLRCGAAMKPRWPYYLRPPPPCDTSAARLRLFGDSP